MTAHSPYRVGLYGGAFDPPHLGHRVVIQNLLDAAELDELWLVPSGPQRHDKQAQAKVEDRLELCRLFIAECFPNEPRIRIERSDADGLIPDSSTMLLLDYLRPIYPGREFSVVIGADNLDQIPAWRFSDRLVREAQFIAIFREGQAEPLSVPSYVRLAPSPLLSGISSSEVRRRIAAGKTVEELLPVSVRKYIEAQGLYR